MSLKRTYLLVCDQFMALTSGRYILETNSPPPVLLASEGSLNSKLPEPFDALRLLWVNGTILDLFD